MKKFQGTPPSRRRVWAAYTTATGVHADTGNWLSIAGYDTPFPGFSDSDLIEPEVAPFTYGSGVITANVNGLIRVHFSVELANNTTGARGIRLRMSGLGGNGQPSATYVGAVSAGQFPLETSYSGPLAAGRTLTAQVYQSSGGNLNILYRGLTIDFEAL